MQATTIKLENPLLGQLKKFLPEQHSLTSFVKGILAREVTRRKMVEAAERYARLLESKHEDASLLEEWEKPGLDKPPSRRRAKAKWAMKRGSVYWVDLEPAENPEFGKVRPGLIISNTEQNLRLPTVVVLPISSKPPEIWPLRMKLPNSLKKESYVVIPGIRQVHKGRLKELVQIVSPLVLQAIDEALFAYLNEWSWEVA